MNEENQTHKAFPIRVLYLNKHEPGMLWQFLNLNYFLPTSVSLSISLLMERINKLVAVQNTGLVIQ
jgi:hypothetical protein